MQSPLRIVHLEDDPHDVTLVHEALRQEGLACDVVHVASRDAFVAELERGAVDLIISDYALPNFDGLSALSLVRRLTPDAPFILVSGTLGEEAAIESLRSGATDYVLKHRLSRLVPAVRRAVEEATERRTRRAAEEALLRERTFLRALLDSLDAGVVACGPDGRWAFLNRATRELHGVPPGPLSPEAWASHYGLYDADGKTPLDAEQTPLNRALQGEHLRHQEIMIRHRNGVSRTVSVSGQPIVGDDGSRLGAVITMRDVSERKKLERQFHQAQKMEAMGRLAAGVAHDFNNLLTVIGGYAQLGATRLDPSHPAVADLAEIAKAGDRATNLTRQLLAFSRQQVLEPRVLDLNAVVVEVENMLRRVIGADVELTVAPGDALGQILADAGQLEQVLMNLVVNARDAIPSGGRISIETSNIEVGDSGAATGNAPLARREVRAAAQEIPCGRYVALTVTDSGVGMDAETAAQIFEPFFTTKESGRGTGLGLSTVHGIVTQSRGHILVQSEPGHGTSFQILFPRVGGARDADSPAAPDAAPRGGSEMVLVVDDDPALRSFVCEVLRARGYGVIPAGDGEAALAILEREGRAIDALVTDVVMPRLSGRALAERMLAVRPDLPVVFMSGYAGENIEALGSLLGARVAFVQKPFAPDVMLARLREVLDARGAAAA